MLAGGDINWSHHKHKRGFGYSKCVQARNRERDVKNLKKGANILNEQPQNCSAWERCVLHDFSGREVCLKVLGSRRKLYILCSLI